MGAAGERRDVETGLGEHRRGRRDMFRRAGMRGAGERDLPFAEPERIGGAAFN